MDLGEVKVCFHGKLTVEEAFWSLLIRSFRTSKSENPD
jgi:hypothetical protein